MGVVERIVPPANSASDSRNRTIDVREILTEFFMCCAPAAKAGAAQRPVAEKYSKGATLDPRVLMGASHGSQAPYPRRYARLLLIPPSVLLTG